MAATEATAGGARRRFVTRHDVEDAAAAGQPVRLGARDVLTHEAAQRARDLGVAVERAAADSSPGSRPSAATQPGSAQPGAVPDAALRAAVRAAVVAELGREPADLDAVIDRVMARG